MNNKLNINSILIICLIFVNVFIYIDYKKYIFNNNKEVFLSSNTTNTVDNTALAYLVETDINSGNYDYSSDNNWPTDTNDIFYKYNSSKSHCMKGGSISFNNVNHYLTVSSNKTDYCYVYFNKYSNTAYNRILNDNGGSSAITLKGTPSYNYTSTTNAGMYSATDSYGTSYYYRGAVNNNWFLFANIYWRIVRINGDNSIRLIYSGTTAPTSDTATVMTGTGTQINTSAFNSSTSTAEYVGYKYTSGSQHGLGTNSTIKSTLDTWYTSNLSSYSSYLTDKIYCNDRSAYSNTSGSSSATGTGTTSQYFGPYVRLKTNKSPIFTCPTISDAFTVSDSTHGNASLTNPVGLLTADEASMAGAVYSNSNSSYYLYTNNEFWTMSPSYNIKPLFINGVYGYTISSTGSIRETSISTSDGIRPVINLVSTVHITGTGVYNDPYRLS